jgi:hypothetical protein
MLRSRVKNNHQHALWVHEKSTARVEDCDLSGNGWATWSIQDGSQVTRRNNRD